MAVKSHYYNRPKKPVTVMISIKTIIILSICLLAGCTASRPEPGLMQRRIISLNERSLVSLEKNRPDDSRRLLEEASRLAASLDDDQQQALTLLNLARLERKCGNYPQAEQLLAQGEYHARGTIFFADLAQELAILKLITGDDSEALKWAETALKRETGDNKARRLNLLARIYKHQGDLDNALVFAEKALQKTDSTVRLAGEKANALRMVGRLKAIKGDFDNGEKILQEALLIDRSLENPTKIAADLEALAETSQLRGDLERSKDYLLRAARVKEQIHPLICGSAADDSN